MRLFLLAAVTASFAAAQVPALPAPQLIERNCAGCHGAGAMSGLDVRTRAALLKGGKRGPALVAGKASASLLFRAIEGAGDLRMPPGKKLTDSERDAIRAWIDQGAPWTDAAAGAAKSSLNPDDVWAFQPLRKVEPAAGAANPVDAFILAKLRERGLVPSPPADRVTLIRRATFDLTGLPPSPEEVAAFVQDASPDAFARVVDRLLASPRYGERWGRLWLDVVRYADSDGYSNDFERPTAWRYRDYVIRSFNQDKPYDRFIQEQIAGDEIWPDSTQARIATGFLRMGPWEHTAMSVAAVTRQLFLDDVTHSTITTFLGLTMGCARCHDHKFDPLPTRDYYGLQAVFATTQFAHDPLPFAAWEQQRGFAQQSGIVQQMIAQTQKRLEEQNVVIRRALLEKQKVSTVEQLPKGMLQQAIRTREGLSPEELARSNAYNKRLEIYKRALERYQPLLYGVQDSAEPVDTFVLTGGDLKSPGEKVSPGVLTTALLATDRDGLPVPAQPEGRRTALARWIASPRNPLTARVMVNRIWQGHFGTGIVASANNFGKMGKRPSHPELLDWLARTFIEHGWSVKQMHRLLMLSDAYRRAAQPVDPEKAAKIDPENQWLSHFPPRRVEAEVLRDTILAVAGDLSLDAGGPGTFPEINQDVADQPRLIMGQISPAYHPSPLRAERNRRTIYTFQKRSIINPVIEVFNGPDLNESCERRDSSIVPTQVFALFNSKFINDEALVLAARLDREAQGAEGRIARAFQLLYSRAPQAAESRLLLDYYARALQREQALDPQPPAPRKPKVRSLVHELTGQSFSLQEEEDPVPYEENPSPAQFAASTRATADVVRLLFNSNEFVYVF